VPARLFLFFSLLAEKVWFFIGFEPELRFVGYVYVKTLQLNITAKNENSYALAA
jgi:hypothetical protein